MSRDKEKLQLWGNLLLALIGLYMTMAIMLAFPTSSKSEVTTIIGLTTAVLALLFNLALYFYRSKINLLAKNIRRLSSLEILFENNNVISEFSKLLEYSKAYHRIVVLLPLSGVEDEHFKREVHNALEGVGNGLKSVDDKAKLRNIEIVIKDHQNKPSEAAQIILEELGRGSRHFICTMSVVCTELSNSESPYFFNKIIDDYSKNIAENVKGNLICTIATSGEINTCDGIYRIYLNVDREVDEIFGYLKPTNKTKGCILVTEDNPNHLYLKSLRESIKNEWKETTSTEITVLRIPDNDNYTNVLNNHASLLMDCDMLFIAMKFSINEKTIKYIINHKLHKDAAYLITPSALPGLHQRKGDGTNNELNIAISKSGLRWVYAEPKKRDEFEGLPGEANSGRFYGEISEYMMNVTIRKLIATITSTNYNPTKFDQIWRDQSFHELRTIPKSVKFEYTNSQYRDPKIELRLNVN